jgi:hypothetical protein
MNQTHRKRFLYVCLLELYFLHNDLWFWSDPRMIFGLPVGLIYHVLYCVAASVLMFALVRYAWPRGLEVEASEEHGK